jgi:5-bromo-4-chloroindolyl phosphate hydrolysis protein
MSLKDQLKDFPKWKRALRGQDTPITERDFSDAALKKESPVKKALAKASTRYSGGVVVGAAATALILGLSPIIFAIGVVGLGATAASLIWHSLYGKPGEREKALAKLREKGLTEEDLKEFIIPSVNSLREMDALLGEFSGDFRKKAQALREVVEAILTNCVDDDPSDIRKICTFPDHLARTLGLLKKYAELQKKASLSTTIRASLADIEKSIAELQQHYVSLFDRLQQNDVDGLEIEAKTLENILKY